jgi:alcohol dehydrogenase
MTSHCRQGGWVLGHTIDGTQAEFTRVPHAEGSLHPAPEGVADDTLAMLSDILPTAYECGVLNGQVLPGRRVAVVGAGPIGLAAVLTARLFSPSEIVVIEPDENRRRAATACGATRTLDPAGASVVEQVLVDGEGVDVAIEAVGVPETFELCQRLVGPGGRIANVGVHGKPALLHLETLWSHNVTVTTRLVDAVTTPMLLGLVAKGQVDPSGLVTHRFRLSQAMEAYETFASASKTGALKVTLRA